MNQFVLQHGSCKELRLFPHILELGIKKNSSIQLNHFPLSATPGLRIYYVMEGKFEWCIQGQSLSLFPGDVALILPDQSFGSTNGVLEIGTYCWIHLAIQKLDSGEVVAGKWS